MQQVLIKLIWATWNIVDVPNYKFDEMIIIIDENLIHIKDQAPTIEAYDSLSLWTDQRELPKSVQMPKWTSN